MGDLARARLAVFTRAMLIQQRTDRLHDLDVLALGVAAHVVGLADLALGQHGADRFAVIADDQPVAYLLAIAVDRQWLASERFGDYQRNELFWKVVRAIIVRTIGGQHRQTVGVVERTYQVIGSGFRRGVRRVGRVRRGFGELAGLAQRAVDLIGGHVQKPERILALLRQRLPVVTDRFKQGQGPDHIGLDERARAFDRAIHMALGCEIQHCIGLVFVQQTGD